MEIPPEVAENLGYYVYLYIDPRTDQPFYIGKGTGTRALAHLTETGGSEKVEMIQQIREQGLEPRIDILRYGLTENEAFLVEASLIDFVGTNRIRGRCTASPIASASRKSFFCPLRKGFTYWAGISRASWPSA